MEHLEEETADTEEEEAEALEEILGPGTLGSAVASPATASTSMSSPPWSTT